MADGLLSGLTNWIDQRKQAAKASIGLLADNPQEWLAQTTARYLPTKEEEQQYKAVKQAGGDITQTPYYQKIFDLAQFQSSLKPLSKTQFQVANEVAQKNATEMLGLPSDNTAMDRAKALGFDTVGYRGTNIEEIFHKNPIWWSQDPQYASAYAAHTIRPPKGQIDTYAGNVMPLLVKQGKSKEFEKFSSGGVPLDPFKGFDNGVQTGFRLYAKNDITGDMGGKVWEALTIPKNVRSRFAAFDPARVNEADLLAAGVPLGLIGSTQVELPKKQEKKPKK
jgi:hypothetical protein